MTSDGEVSPPAGTAVGDAGSTADSDPGIEAAAPDQAFRAELAAMGLIPSDEVGELSPPVPATPDAAAPGPGSNPIGSSIGVGSLPGQARLGNVRRAPLHVGPRLARSLRALTFALHRSVLEPSLAADVRRDRELATGLRATTSGCRRVLVLSAGEGCGQTSVAALIVLTLSRVREDRVAAIDLDPESNSLASRLGQRQAPTAGEILVAARRERQSGSPSPRLGRTTSLAVLRIEGQDANQIDEAMQALLTVERGVAVTVVDPGFTPGVFLLDTLLAGTRTLVVVAPAGNEPLAEGLLGVVAARGHEGLADTAIIVRRGERPAVRRPRSAAGSTTILPMPPDDSLTGAEVLDLAALRPATRRAVTAISLAVMADRRHPAALDR